MFESIVLQAMLATEARVVQTQSAEAKLKVIEVTEVDRAWAGHEVGFALITRGDAQYASYYDAERDMTVSVRRRAGGKWGPWEKTELKAASPVFGAKGTPTRTGWDSHNYVALGFDADGQIHLSGNMHCNPLLYFRTTRPGDPSSFERIDRMTGDREHQVTYPRFFQGPTGELVFSYRDGYSGNGADLYNVYDPATKTWRRLLDRPLTDGRNPADGKTAYAYMRGPTLGPDGYYHAVWVWRDNGNCETNHSLSYVRSRDLVSWEDSSGKPVAIPITPQTSEVVDPVPVKGGMINNNTLIGFDAEKRVVLTYHKFDANGKTQVYNARREKDGWRIAPASNWDFRWWFEGGGSMIFQVRLGAVEVSPDGRLRQTWWNQQDGEGGAYLDPVTLAPVAPYRAPAKVPSELQKPESTDPRMKVRWADDTGDKGDGRVRYVMRWETLPTNRDRAPEGAIPAPGALRVYAIEGD